MTAKVPLDSPKGKQLLSELSETLRRASEMKGKDEPTPGPWRECGRDRGGCQCHIVWSTSADSPVATAFDPKHAVACVHGEWGDGPDMVYGEVPPDQARANARLIACAPDLLAAAERVVKYAVDLHGSHSIYDGDFQMLRAALSKAQGGQ